eukprot:Selendium_serpulae@DN2188_c0_g1_i1.p1
MMLQHCWEGGQATASTALTSGADCTSLRTSLCCPMLSPTRYTRSDTHEIVRCDTPPAQSKRHTMWFPNQPTQVHSGTYPRGYIQALMDVTGGTFRPSWM